MQQATYTVCELPYTMKFSNSFQASVQRLKYLRAVNCELAVNKSYALENVGRIWMAGASLIENFTFLICIFVREFNVIKSTNFNRLIGCKTRNSSSQTSITKQKWWYTVFTCIYLQIWLPWTPAKITDFIRYCSWTEQYPMAPVAAESNSCTVLDGDREANDCGNKRGMHVKLTHLLR